MLQDGLATQAEQALPPAPRSELVQTASAQPRWLPGALVSWVPPTAVTLARSAGKLAEVYPRSPLEATTVWPGRL